MITQAYFEDIQHHIKKELNKARSSIYIAVAWFTDSELFKILCLKAQEGVSVKLMLIDDEINNGSGIDYSKLSAISYQQSAKADKMSTNKGEENVSHSGKNVKHWKGTGKVWMIITAGENGNLMHNKFCDIDGETVINGSYNWINRAKQNYESITVIYEATELARQFITEFSAIKEKYLGADVESVVIDYGKICMRLETLKNVILLEDKEDIEFQLRKLRQSLKMSDGMADKMPEIDGTKLEFRSSKDETRTLNEDKLMLFSIDIDAINSRKSLDFVNGTSYIRKTNSHNLDMPYREDMACHF